MGIPKELELLAGNFTGHNKVWLKPGTEGQFSETTALVVPVVNSKFLRIEYDWAIEGKPQEGSLHIGQVHEVIHAVWMDSWHNGDVMMVCRGSVDQKGSINVNGKYSAPSGPDWGWRIELTAMESSGFSIRMYNIQPDGDEALAVEALYARL